MAGASANVMASCDDIGKAWVANNVSHAAAVSATGSGTAIKRYLA